MHNLTLKSSCFIESDFIRADFQKSHIEASDFGESFLCLVGFDESVVKNVDFSNVKNFGIKNNTSEFQNSALPKDLLEESTDYRKIDSVNRKQFR